jgi:DNA-directed RNA polymerase subunit RPC12/RpoP
MKNAIAIFDFTMVTECPYCNHENDLDYDSESPFFDLFKDWINNKKNSEYPNESTFCSQCGKEFLINEIIR